MAEAQDPDQYFLFVPLKNRHFDPDPSSYKKYCDKKNQLGIWYRKSKKYIYVVSLQKSGQYFLDTL